MDINTAIEIEAWGDFDVKTTKCIMVSEEKLNPKELIKTYCELRGLPGLSGLPYNMLNDTNDDLIIWLKRQGFKQLKTYAVCFSD